MWQLLFGKALADLSLDDVREFLDGAEEEGLTWEAKADGKERVRPAGIQKAVCALANQVGGYVIVGAAQEDGAWELVGMDARGGEPKLWLGKAVGGVLPTPSHAIRVFDLGGGRWAGVIEIQPSAETPCVTSLGQVFERLGSESKPVNEPSRLAALIERGKVARESAELRTQVATSLAEGSYLDSTKMFVRVTVAVAATNSADDQQIHVFTERFRALLVDQFEQRLVEEGPFDDKALANESLSIAQHHLQREATNRELDWLVRVGLDHSAVVTARVFGDSMRHLAVFAGVIEPAWRLALDLVNDLGGYGGIHLRLTVTTGVIAAYIGEFFQALPGRTEVVRWVTPEGPTEAEVTSIQRELNRAAGRWQLES